MASAAGTAQVDFGGPVPVSSRAQVVVTGQTGLVAGDHVEAWIMREDVAGATGHSPDEHELLADDASVLCEVTAVGEFTITVRARTQWTGLFNVRWVWLSA